MEDFFRVIVVEGRDVLFSGSWSDCLAYVESLGVPSELVHVVRVPEA